MMVFHVSPMLLLVLYPRQDPLTRKDAGLPQSIMCILIRKEQGTVTRKPSTSKPLSPISHPSTKLLSSLEYLQGILLLFAALPAHSPANQVGLVPVSQGSGKHVCGQVIPETTSVGRETDQGVGQPRSAMAVLVVSLPAPVCVVAVLVLRMVRLATALVLGHIYTLLGRIPRHATAAPWTTGLALDRGSSWEELLSPIAAFTLEAFFLSLYYVPAIPRHAANGIRTVGRWMLLAIRSCALTALFIWGYWWGMGGIELDEPVIDKTKGVEVGKVESGPPAGPQSAQAKAQAGNSSNKTGGHGGIVERNMCHELDAPLWITASHGRSLHTRFFAFPRFPSAFGEM
ncbi:hypothetical protein ACRALDRAFT_205941 [Sodiomyces alcalophilus JCM 7366]|uniref:uncharacterized protein n=1 Tax=Sodiomyces alcalophilus JCM 7366 TaxID=591952 RepID=UPI0039B4EF61